MRKINTLVDRTFKNENRDLQKMMQPYGPYSRSSTRLKPSTYDGILSFKRMSLYVRLIKDIDNTLRKKYGDYMSNTDINGIQFIVKNGRINTYVNNESLHTSTKCSCSRKGWIFEIPVEHIPSILSEWDGVHYIKKMSEKPFSVGIKDGFSCKISYFFSDLTFITRKAYGNMFGG